MELRRDFLASQSWLIRLSDLLSEGLSDSQELELASVLSSWATQSCVGSDSKQLQGVISLTETPKTATTPWAWAALSGFAQFFHRGQKCDLKCEQNERPMRAKVCVVKMSEDSLAICIAFLPEDSHHENEPEWFAVDCAKLLEVGYLPASTQLVVPSVVLRFPGVELRMHKSMNNPSREDESTLKAFVKMVQIFWDLHRCELDRFIQSTRHRLEVEHSRGDDQRMVEYENAMHKYLECLETGGEESEIFRHFARYKRAQGRLRVMSEDAEWMQVGTASEEDTAQTNEEKVAARCRRIQCCTYK